MKQTRHWFWCGVVLHGYASDSTTGFEPGELYRHFGLRPQPFPPLYSMIINEIGTYIVLTDVIYDPPLELDNPLEIDIIDAKGDLFRHALKKLNQLPDAHFASWRALGRSLDVAVCLCPSRPYLKLAIPSDFLKLSAQLDLSINIYNGPYDCE